MSRRSVPTRRIAVTLGVLLVYRLGCAIPLPIERAAGTFATWRTVFALGLTPYVWACMFLHLARRLRWSFAGHDGEAASYPLRASRHAHCLTFAIAVFMAIQWILGVERTGWLDPRDVPGVVTAAATLVAGAMLNMWLAERIDVHGLGSGAALIWAVFDLVRLPAQVGFVAHAALPGEPNYLALAALGLVVAQVSIVVVLTRARRRTERGAGVHHDVPMAHDAVAALMFALAALAALQSALASLKIPFVYGTPSHAVVAALLVAFFAASCGSDPFCRDVEPQDVSTSDVSMARTVRQDLGRERRHAALVGAAVLAPTCVVVEALASVGILPVPLWSITTVLVALAALGALDRLGVEADTA